MSLVSAGEPGPFMVLGTIDGAPPVGVRSVGDSSSSSALTCLLQQLVVVAGCGCHQQPWWFQWKSPPSHHLRHCCARWLHSGNNVHA